jgi:DNA-binding CsgD family transcriptional regulator
MPPGPAPKGQPKPDRAQMNLRDEKILRMMIAGASEREIARTVGLTRARVNQILKREIQRGDKHRQLLADEALTVHVARLETLIKAAWGKAINGDLKAIEVVRKAAESEARVLGVMPGAAVPSVAEDLSEFDMDDPGDRDELALYRRRHRRRSELDGGL